jgi:CHAT domain-containing protein
MRDFYAELKLGTGRAEALRRAKLRMLAQPRLAHSYYWSPSSITHRVCASNSS